MKIFIIILVISANALASYESEEDKEYFGGRDCQREIFNSDIGRIYLRKAIPILQTKMRDPDALCNELGRDPEIVLATLKGQASFNKIKSDARFKDTTSVEHLPAYGWVRDEAEMSKGELCAKVRIDIDGDDFNGYFAMLRIEMLKRDFLNSGKESCLLMVPDVLKAIQKEK